MAVCFVRGAPHACSASALGLDRGARDGRITWKKAVGEKCLLEFGEEDQDAP